MTGTASSDPVQPPRALPAALPAPFFTVLSGTDPADIALPDGYALREDGLFFRSPDDAKSAEEWLCTPLCPLARTRRPDGRGWGALVAMPDPTGRIICVRIDAVALAERPGRALRPLIDRGLRIANRKSAKARIVEAIAGAELARTLIVADQLGWADEACGILLFPDHVPGTAGIVLDENLKVVGAQTRGTMEQWRDMVASPCSGNPLAILAVSHAFSGPLLRILGMDGGGFHLRGASTSGKSTILAAAASVWSDPSALPSWRSTDNGIEDLAAMCNDRLLALDEMHQAAPKVVDASVYMLANGRPKRRMGFATGANWRVSVLSTGEISLEMHLAQLPQGAQAGQDVRLIDLVSDDRRFGAFDDLHGETSPAAFAQALNKTAQQNFGVAGRIFAQALAKQETAILKVTIEATMKAMAVSMENGLPSSPDALARRVLRRFALAAAAGELATKFGLTGWPRTTAFKACTELFRRWHAQHLATAPAQLVHVRTTLAAYLASGPALPDRAAAAVVGEPEPDGWQDPDHVYLRPETTNRVFGGFDAAKSALRALRDAELLRVEGPAALTFTLSRRDERHRVHAIRKDACG